MDPNLSQKILERLHSELEAGERDDPSTKSSQERLMEQLVDLGRSQLLVLNRIADSVVSLDTAIRMRGLQASLHAPREVTSRQEAVETVTMRAQPRDSDKWSDLGSDDFEFKQETDTTFEARPAELVNSQGMSSRSLDTHSDKLEHPYRDRSDLMTTLIMSVYQTIIGSCPVFEEVTHRPDFVSTHSKHSHIVLSVSKALGNGVTVIPDVKSDGMKKISKTFVRSEKGEVFVISAATFRDMKLGASTQHLIGITQDIAAGLSKVTELLEFPLSAAVKGLRKKFLVTEGNNIEYDVNIPRITRAISKASGAGAKVNVTHKDVPAYVFLRIRGSLTSKEALKAIFEGTAADEIERIKKGHPGILHRAGKPMLVLSDTREF